MISRKRKKNIIIATIITIILVLAISYTILYITTDSFKSNAKLFRKYMAQNTNNLENLYATSDSLDDFEKTLKENKYTTRTQVKVNYTENMGKSTESTENAINKLRLTIEGQKDETNGYDYQNIKLLNNNENAMQVEYIKNQNTYGLKFSDLFNQYILVENSNLSEIFKKMRVEGEYPEEINLSNIKFSKEEITTLGNKYIAIIGKDLSKENFSKQSNQTIKINDKDLKVNEYTLKMTKEQLNNTYIKILEELKQDEVILNKLENIQQINNIGSLLGITEESSFKDEFVNKIDEIIQKITSNNIGDDETTISVYESNGITVRTSIVTNEYQITYDLLQTDVIFTEISLANTIQDKESKQTITMKKENNTLDVNIEEISGEYVKNTSFNETKKIDGNDYEKDITMKYEAGTDKVELKMEQKNKIVEELETVTLNNENSINLQTLENQKLQELVNKVSTSVNEKINKMSETIKFEDITKVLNIIGILPEKQNMNDIGITETEKIRFNSQFELLKAESVKNDDINQTVEIIKNNLVGIEVVSPTTVKLKVARNDHDEELSNIFLQFMENMNNQNYDISLEYNEETGLVEYVIFNIVKDD